MKALALLVLFSSTFAMAENKYAQRLQKLSKNGTRWSLIHANAQCPKELQIKSYSFTHGTTDEDEKKALAIEVVSKDAYWDNTVFAMDPKTAGAKMVINNSKGSSLGRSINERFQGVKNGILTLTHYDGYFGLVGSGEMDTQMKMKYMVYTPDSDNIYLMTNVDKAKGECGYAKESLVGNYWQKPWTMVKKSMTHHLKADGFRSNRMPASVED